MSQNGESSRPRMKIVYQSDPASSGGTAVRSGDSVTGASFSSSKKMNSPQYETSDMRGTYDEIVAALQGTGKLWEDPDFRAEDASLSVRQQRPTNFKWQRPIELVEKPMFIEDGASRFDVRQGELGDCWLLAAVASMSIYKELFNHVVPPDQDFSENYCGVFRFHFWRFGTWFEVCVDDRLPAVNGELIYMHSVTKSEFWSALLEKAYAKLVGSYEALKGGSAGEAMEDFTGGVNEIIDLKNSPPKDLPKIMLKAVRQSSLMGCSIDADPQRREAFLSNGLIMGHAYSVTDVKQMTSRQLGALCLVRVRNPWGNENEWNGAWGDSSDEWTRLSAGEKQALGVAFSADGEFWMSVEDFAANFEKLEICHLGPDSMSPGTLDGKQKRRWEATVQEGSWMKNVNAGGCRNFIATFWTNPQFRVRVVDPDEDDDDAMGTIIVGLMQKDRRKYFREGLDFLPIGYLIYKIDDRAAHDAKPLGQSFFKFSKSVARSSTFINVRENCARHKLVPGHYVIVPSTYQPAQEADFILRVFSEQPTESEEMDLATDEADMTGVDEDDSVEMSDDNLRFFRELAGDDETVDAVELMDILNAALRRDKTINADEFSLETCRSMVALMDVDKNGTLGFHEFQILWRNFTHWKAVFQRLDKDKTATFNSYELRQALMSVGFSVSNRVFAALATRFSNRKGEVEFDDFILCCVRLRDIFKTIRDNDTDQHNNHSFGQEEFMECILYV